MSAGEKERETLKERQVEYELMSSKEVEKFNNDEGKSEKKG